VIACELSSGTSAQTNAGALCSQAAKNDPDLIRLEEEAEEAVSELSAGDEKVKQTLDQLIESHHDHGHDFTVTVP
jgi:hypothetical protein